ncbi:GNAT family N-acetyltransferase [Micromonospora sp. NBC_01813]|uniref:GNAT family N-acetyltransferase n=1 Tax=Micromonospora sp. NBC_01813 TaxID=2975988 RepID=UPI002DD91527|nr:GNAT family N-acetyltransferase [Micromonospora sp. NBC_01813]WSA09232.1 GNAT family N-acetyltransferase [Micromonospora sp. NBC_01813]
MQHPARPQARPQARRATTADAPALVRLRVVMLHDMGAPIGDESAEWRSAALDWFTQSLDDPNTFAAFVVDDPRHGIVSNAIGQCDRHAPSPGNPGGLRGHLFNVCTEPAHRGHGYARDCVQALIDWFATDTSVSVVDLNATTGSGNLYQSLGFAPSRHPALQLRRDQMSTPVSPAG